MERDDVIVMDYAKKIEAILSNKFPVRGNGLGEKFRSIESYLPSETVNRLHRVNRIRNIAAHEMDFVLYDPQGFQSDCEQIIYDLQNLSAPSPSYNGYSDSYPNSPRTFYQKNQNLILKYLSFIKESPIKIFCFVIGLLFWASVILLSIKDINWFNFYSNIFTKFWSPSSDVVLNLFINISVIVLSGFLLYSTILSVIFLAIIGLYLLLIGIVAFLLLWVASLSTVGLITSAIALIILLYLGISNFLKSDFFQNLKSKLSKGH